MLYTIVICDRPDCVVATLEKDAQEFAIASIARHIEQYGERPCVELVEQWVISAEQALERANKKPFRTLFDSPFNPYL